MNIHVYNHMRKQREELSNEQSRVYRKLKTLWIESRKRFCINTAEKFEIQELEALNESLNSQMSIISDKMLTFELFGDK